MKRSPPDTLAHDMERTGRSVGAPDENWAFHVREGDEHATSYLPVAGNDFQAVSLFGRLIEIVVLGHERAASSTTWSEKIAKRF